MPRRMSVAPVASQTRTPDGGIIIGAALSPRGATLARWLDRCLGVFPSEEWSSLAEKIRGLPRTNPNAREFVRFMSSGAVDIELDRQGRLLVPSYLREYAGLADGEVVIVGALDHLEIWAPSAWQPYRARIEGSPEELAAHLQDLGI